MKIGVRKGPYLDTGNQLSSKAIEPENQEKLAIVTLCTTGEGGAALVKSILVKHLKFGDIPIEVIPISIVGNQSITAKLKNIREQYRLICLVGSFKVDTEITQFGIDEVLNQTALKDIQELIDIETTYLKIGDTFENHFQNVDAGSVLKGVKKFIDNIENSLGIKIDTSVLIGIAIHIGCMIDRLKGGGSVDEFQGKQQYISENFRLYTLIKQESDVLNQIFQINIPEDEICCMMVFFNPKNYV